MGFQILHTPAALFVCTVPLTLYLFGIRQFIMVMDVVGGVFVSLEMLMMVMIYWHARQRGKIKGRKSFWHHALLTSGVVFVALLVGTVYNISKYF